MKISSKTQYALKIMLDLTMHARTSIVTAHSIAKRQGIPAKFLEQILLLLKGAALVESKRGAQGGYRLMRDPAEISLASIIAVTEKSFLHSRTEENKTNNLGPYDEVWAELDEIVNRKLNSITLKVMCERAKKLQAQTVLEFVI